MSTDGPTARRRQKSITKGDVPTVPKRVYKSHLDRPIHAPRESVLRWGVTRPPLNGFFNLAVVLALCGALSFIIGNLNRHGLRVAPYYWLEAFKVDGEISSAPLALVIPLPFFVAGTFLIEKRIAAGLFNNFSGRIAHSVWILIICIYPMVVMQIFGRLIPFFPACQMFIAYTAIMLKMWSYAQTNRWCREKKTLETKEEREERDGGVAREYEQRAGIVYGPQVEYPNNLTVKELAYFIAAPTLCYELNYPKTARRNYASIAYRLVELIVCVFIFFSLVQQWLLPAHKKALIPYANGDTWVFIERMLITAVAQNIVWLLFFYTVFHCGLLLVAEITCFADRKFYDTWWQAENLDSFWRKWNLPVHNWAVRHMYIPMLRRGYGKRISQYAVFIFSGLFHEYATSPPLRILRGHFVFGFILQAMHYPLLGWIERRLGRNVSNGMVWFYWSHQCLVCFMYFYGYIEDHYSLDAISEFQL